MNTLLFDCVLRRLHLTRSGVEFDTQENWTQDLVAECDNRLGYRDDTARSFGQQGWILRYSNCIGCRRRRTVPGCKCSSRIDLYEKHC